MKKELREEIRQVKVWLIEAEMQESQTLFRIVRMYAIPLLEKLEKTK